MEKRNEKSETANSLAEGRRSAPLALVIGFVLFGLTPVLGYFPPTRAPAVGLQGQRSISRWRRQSRLGLKRMSDAETAGSNVPHRLSALRDKTACRATEDFQNMSDEIVQRLRAAQGQTDAANTQGAAILPPDVNVEVRTVLTKLMAGE